MRMIQFERIQKMLEYLSEREVLTLEETIRLLGASSATIRRDFGQLAKQKLARRVRGGIAAIKPSPGEIAAFTVREVQHPVEKRAIAACAASLLQPGDAVIIDAGTTTRLIASCVPKIPLRIITTSIRLAAELDVPNIDRSRLEVYVVGGTLSPYAGAVLGPTTEAMLAQYHAQWAFLSVGGITPRGISNTNELVVQTQRAMIESAEKVVILADHSKIGKQAMCGVCNLDKIHVLITDEWPENRELLQGIGAAGVKVITVSHDAGNERCATLEPVETASV